MTVNTSGYAYVEEQRPISFAVVNNSEGYLDLAIHKTKNGKALRIVNKAGDKVCVTLGAIDDLVKKLLDVKAKGASTSVDVLPFGVY